MKNEITFMTKSGAEIKVVSGLITSEVINLDGHRTTVGCCHKTFDVSINGKRHPASGMTTEGYPKVVNGTTIHAAMGRLYLSDADDVIKIQSVIDATENSSEWQADLARRAKNDAEIDKYEAGYDAVIEAMSY